MEERKDDETPLLKETECPVCLQVRMALSGKCWSCWCSEDGGADGDILVASVVTVVERVRSWKKIAGDEFIYYLGLESLQAATIFYV